MPLITPRFRGGYTPPLQGRPSAEIRPLPDPDALYLPLRGGRCAFTELHVSDGECVLPGRRLASDPANYGVPLLAPRKGVVRLGQVEGHIVLDVVSGAAAEFDQTADPQTETAPNPREQRRFELRRLGAWRFFSDAFTGAIPDPRVPPAAILVSTVRLDPFVTRGDVLLRQRMAAFAKGLEQLQSLLEYQPIYLVLPDVQSKLGEELRQTLRGHAFLRTVLIPLKYPFGHYSLLARKLGCRPIREQPVWAVDVAGVLAADDALTHGRPATDRAISVGGPAARDPCHLLAPEGYPMADVARAFVSGQSVRLIRGGILAGETVPASQRGLDLECEGLTILPEQTEREFLAYARLGGGPSYSRCFLGRRGAAPGASTAVGGLGRACISCGLCEEVCPLGLMPYLIHRYLYRDALDLAEQAGLDRCIGCGLCAYVCPSKIELREQFIQAQRTLAEERRPDEGGATLKPKACACPPGRSGGPT